MLPTEFRTALLVWKQAAEQLQTAERALAKAESAAMLVADGKNAETRAAQVKLVAEKEREARDTATIAMQLARWEIDFLLRIAGTPSPIAA